MPVPDFEIISANGPVPDDMIVDLRGFYIHMMNFVVEAVYDGPTTDVLCRFIDEDNNIFTSTLEYDGYQLSLTRCLEYFERNEEFEKCTTIKKILKNL
jgi:hypothetical protein